MAVGDGTRCSRYADHLLHPADRECEIRKSRLTKKLPVPLENSEPLATRAAVPTPVLSGFSYTCTRPDPSSRNVTNENTAVELVPLSDGHGRVVVRYDGSSKRNKSRELGPYRYATLLR